MKDQRGDVMAGVTITWTSSNEAVAVVTATGLATAIAPGTVAIRAAAGGEFGEVRLTITPAAIAGITITPGGPLSCMVGASFPLAAVITDARGHVLGGRVVDWFSDATTIASVSPTGAVTCAMVGQAHIRATSEGHEAIANVVVSAVPVASLSVTPAEASVFTGTTVTLTAVAKDASGAVLRGRVVSWNSLSPLVAIVSPAGVVTGAGIGAATIEASSEGKTAASVVTVLPVPVGSVVVTGAIGYVEVGSSITLTATTKDSAGNVLVGRTVTWQSSTPSTATVSPSGVVTGVAFGGPVTITATCEGAHGTDPIRVITPLPPAAQALVADIHALPHSPNPAADIQVLLPQLQALVNSLSDNEWASVLISMEVVAFADTPMADQQALMQRLGGTTTRLSAPSSSSGIRHSRQDTWFGAAVGPTRVPGVDPVVRVMAINGIVSYPFDLYIVKAKIEQVASSLAAWSGTAAGGYLFDLFYNPTSNFASDILESAIQLYFQGTARTTAIGAQLADTINASQSRHEQVLMVAHSQGNLITSEALKKVTFPECVGVVSIAAPSWNGWPTTAVALQGMIAYDPPAYDVVFPIATFFWSSPVGPPPPAPFIGITTQQTRLLGAHWQGYSDAKQLHGWIEHYLSAPESIDLLKRQLEAVDTELRDRCGKVKGPDSIQVALARAKTVAVSVIRLGGQPILGRKITAVESENPSIATGVPSADGDSVVVHGLGLGRTTLKFWSGPAGGKMVVTVDTSSVDIVRITTGWSHTCALTSTGRAFCWGRNNNWQLGDGTQVDRPTPVEVSGNLVFSSLTSGGDHTCGLTGVPTDGSVSPTSEVFCWGAVPNMQPNATPYTMVREPRADLSGFAFASVVTSSDHSCGLDASGTAYCWGNSRWGKLGDGGTSDLLPGPIDMTGIGHPPRAVVGGHSFVQLALGLGHTCGLTGEGETYCWGLSSHGQLGVDPSSVALLDVNGNNTYWVPTPTRVEGAPPFVAIAAGGIGTCGLTSAGAAWCWGDWYVKAYQNPPAWRPSPIPGDHIFQSLMLSNENGSAGAACGLTTNGELWCWGFLIGWNIDPVPNSAPEDPRPVAVNKRFVQATGLQWFVTCGITASGLAYCWTHGAPPTLVDFP